MIGFSVKFPREAPQALGLGVPYPQFGTPKGTCDQLAFDDIKSSWMDF